MPRLEPEDPARFHNEFVSIIHREFKFIEKASAEVDKIINLYHMLEGYEVQDAAATTRSLFLSTFNHLLNIDENLKVQPP